jgi:hypothetical protein
MTREHALKLREMVVKASASLDDKDASTSPELFPRMKYDGALIPYQTRINWNGAIKMAAADLWDTEENNPDNAPALWSDLKYRDGIRIIPEVITAAEAFAKGERGWWEDELYESLIDANVYTPAQYPEGWRLVE